MAASQAQAVKSAAATAEQQVTSKLKAAHASELSAAVRKAEAAASSKGAEALAQQKASLSQANAAELQKAVAAAKSGAGGEAQQQVMAPPAPSLFTLLFRPCLTKDQPADLRGAGAPEAAADRAARCGEGHRHRRGGQEGHRRAEAVAQRHAPAPREGDPRRIILS